MDICKCTGEGCQKKQSCYRYTAEASYYQSYFETPPNKDGQCDHYWKVSEEPKELMRIKNGEVYIDGELVSEEELLLVYRQLLSSQYPWNKENKQQ